VTLSDPIPIALPELGSPHATLSLWHVRPGDRVFEGDRVAEVLLPGALFDVAAPVNGILVERLALAGDRLTASQVLGLIREERPDSH
jgi:pyruvate/2-oxoglutarate dehydrogenase complex dihydrolipoamide acyltransferase (E2) component